ncbi:MAG: transketolase [Desulfobacteraceae bacterium]|nr:transketolase [Desulfobacteraceae bacterium]MBC2757170.1 transketolase [Desulfobacteraceae bacterium]
MKEWTAGLEIDTLCVNTIRTLSMDAIQKANSGHPGAPMGLAPAAYILWTRFLKHNPQNPDWYDRDRFVLSGGHASMLLYSLLFLTGYGLTLDDIKNFRQWGSKTPGHPEFGHTTGVETTTGPLGQGVTNAVGMAMAERHLSGLFNQSGHDIVNHNTFVMCGDGDMMEGITSEAASIAGHLGLSKLICLYDDNRISIEGSTDIAFTEDVALRFQAYNWQVITVEDGNNLDEISNAIDAAIKETDKPSLIQLRTHIAFGSPNKQDTADAHGAPLGEEEVKLTKQCLGCLPDEQFCVPDGVLAHCRGLTQKGADAEEKWNAVLDAYKNQFPELATQWAAMMNGSTEGQWEVALPDFSDSEGPIATRSASGTVLNAAASKIPALIGGSADLAPSNKTIINGSSDFQKDNYSGRNIRFGVREHAMGGILNGMSLHKGLRPFGGTFLVFADYMRPSIRLAALMNQPVIYVFTHDSVAVGEDGPTHQPVEHLTSLRMIPNLTVIRPADATETAAAWRHAIKSNDTPTALILSRQKLPVIDRSKYPSSDLLENGAYVLADSDGTPDVILIASGSEVSISIEAGKKLAGKGVAVRVVSMPSWELFDKMPEDYKDSVLPPTVKSRVAVEAGLPLGWEKYTSDAGVTIGISTFGASAPGGTVLKNFGFTVDNIVETALKLL